MHVITTDLKTGIIEIEVEGFWTVDHVADFAVELERHARSVQMCGKRQAVLYDYTRAAIQSQEVVAALRDLAQRDTLRTRKVALYTGGRLARMQARRVAEAGARICVFEDRQQALDWLTAA